MEYTIREGFSNMDMSVVMPLLADTYWWREYDNAPDLILQAAKNSDMVIGAFLSGGEQIGYARVLTDYVRLAYIADVFVRGDCRRHGVGSALLQYILHAPALSVVRKFLLITGDAHALYAKNGFCVTSRGSDYMEWTRDNLTTS